MSLLELFMFFFKISSVTFGGGIVILGMVQLEQSKRKDIDPEEFADMISLAASMPGPIAVSIAWILGRHYKGIKGSLVSVLGVVLPPFTIILLLSPIVLKYSHLPQVQGFFKGILAGTGAIITFVIVNNVKGALTSTLWNVIPYALILTMIGLLHIHPIIAMASVLIIQIIKEKVITE
ncbi:MAG: chromate transporter [Synergistaceae bacterium]